MYDHKDEKVKREATLPVQSRVDFRCLATLSSYLVKKGVSIGSMSQLISVAVDMLIEMLKLANGIKREEEVISITDAISILEQRGLTQSALMERSRSKLLKAVGFEELRLQGIDPENYAPSQFKQIHNVGVSKVIRTVGDEELLEVGKSIMKRMKMDDQIRGTREIKGPTDELVIDDPQMKRETIPSIAGQRSNEEIEADRVAKDKVEEEKLKGLDDVPEATFNLKT